MHIKEPRVQLDHALLQSRRQLIDFSIMADTKANILLSISSVITTLILTRVTDPKLMAAAIVLLCFLLPTVLMALLTLIPNIRIRRQKRSVTDPDFNPFFFGDYTSVKYDEYLAHMEEVLNDPSRTYEVQVRELYFAGQYLQHTKYNYVKLGYIFFFIGLISSTIVYVVENIL